MTEIKNSKAECLPVFRTLGVKPVINACGIYTDLGGSILSEDVWGSLGQLNTSYVDLTDLLDKTGESIAKLVGAEAARITPGASAGIALACAAVMAGNHGPYWEQLPDTTGMRDEIIMQRPQVAKYQYLNPIRISGAKVIEVGTDEFTTLDDLQNAITDKTSAIFVPAHLDSMENIVKLERLGKFSKDNNIKLLVDAAYQVFPIENLRKYAKIGADLTIVSSKYFFGPNAGGFLSGTKELMDVVTGLDFTRYESGPYRTFGRPFKMGRYEIAAVYLALKKWLEADHDARWRGYADKARYIKDALNGTDGLSAYLCCFTFEETIEASPINAVMVNVTHPRLTAQMVGEQLQAGYPAIHTVPYQEKILVVTETLQDGEEGVISNSFAGIISQAGDV